MRKLAILFLALGIVFAWSDAESKHRIAPLICDTKEQVIEWLNLSSGMSRNSPFFEVEGCGFFRHGQTSIEVLVVPLEAYENVDILAKITRLEFPTELGIQYGFFVIKVKEKKREYKI